MLITSSKSTSTTTPALPRKPPATPPCDPVDSHGSLYEAANSSVAVMAGLTQGITRIIVGGCAGAAQGIVHGADLKEDQARLAFKIAMGANLAVTGALAGGVGGLDFLALSPAQGAMAGAATNVMVGNSQWDMAPGMFQEKVRQTSSQWLDSTLSHLPEGLSKDPGALAKVARCTLGNIVGMAAGTYTGVTMIGSNYRQGHQWGSHAFDQAAQFLTPPDMP